MTQYALTATGAIIRVADGAGIPADPANADYQRYLTWREAGNVPLNAEVPAPGAPAAVTMRQARLALLAAGLVDSIDAAIGSMPSPQREAARIEWEYSQEVQRHNGFVSVLAPLLGLTDAQVDALFFTAAGL